MKSLFTHQHRYEFSNILKIIKSSGTLSYSFLEETMEIPCPKCATETLEADSTCLVTEKYFFPVTIDGKQHQHDGNVRKSRVTCTQCGSSFCCKSIASCSYPDCDWNKNVLTKGVLNEQISSYPKNKTRDR